MNDVPRSMQVNETCPECGGTDCRLSYACREFYCCNEACEHEWEVPENYEIGWRDKKRIAYWTAKLEYPGVMGNEEYADQMICPVCGSKSIQRPNSRSVDSSNIYVACICLHCRSSWEEVKELRVVGYRKLLGGPDKNDEDYSEDLK